jgi:hypothetical protein
VTAFNYQQIVVDGVEISEVWGLIDAAPGSHENNKRGVAVKEWLSRHADRARANGYKWSRASVDPKDPGHLLFEAWPTRPDDEGPPRWFGGDAF